MSAARELYEPWETFHLTQEGDSLNEVEQAMRAEELERVLTWLRKLGAEAYRGRMVHRSLVIAELVGRLERGEHRS